MGKRGQTATASLCFFHALVKVRSCRTLCEEASCRERLLSRWPCGLAAPSSTSNASPVSDASPACASTKALDVGETILTREARRLATYSAAEAFSAAADDGLIDALIDAGPRQWPHQWPLGCWTASSGRDGRVRADATVNEPCAAEACSDVEVE